MDENPETLSEDIEFDWLRRPRDLEPEDDGT